MMSLLLSRPSRQLPLAAPPSTGMRVEVCPPSLLEAAEPALSRWLRRLGRGASGRCPAQRMQAVREEFMRSLDGVPGQHADFLQHRLGRCRSMLELWHLRSEVFGVIATQLSEHEAQARLAPLNRHFPTRSPRSGFAPLDA